MSTNPRHVAPAEPGGDWTCRDCGATIMAVTQTCSIWDGPGPCSGSGKTEQREAPYCPNCETKPDWRGTPIRVRP